MGETLLAPRTVVHGPDIMLSPYSGDGTFSTYWWTLVDVETLST